jgi:hypothetical protein
MHSKIATNIRAIVFESNAKTDIAAVDSTGHSLNDEFERVNINASQEKTAQEKINPNRAADAVKVMKPAIENTRQQGFALLTALE